MRLASLLGLVALSTLSSAAFADPITGLYSTGLASVGTSDPHYILTSAPSGATSSNAVVSTTNGGWYHSPTSTQWIDPSGSGNATEPTGVYTYETTFTLLPSQNVSTAQLNLQLAADDAVKVYLNSILEGTFNAPTYSALQTDIINSGFVSGLNTLDFVVTNSGGGPTGLFVNATGSVAVTPEPSSLMLLGSGVLGLAGAVRRRFPRT